MSDSAVIAKSRAISGKLLKKEDYDNLIHRGSVSAAVSYLKSTERYGGIFAGADAASLHRGQVEFYLEKAVFESYSRVRKFSSGGSGIMDFYLKSEEVEQISKAIVAVSTGTQERFYLSFPDYLLDELSFPIAAAVRAKTLAELLSVLSGTMYYKPLYPYLSAESPDINKCLSVVHGCYVSWALIQIDKDFRGKRREELKRFFLIKAECDSMVRCYRLKRFFDFDSERMRDIILPYRCRVKQKDVDAALASQDPSGALIRLISDRCVPKSISVDPDFPESAVARAHYGFFRRRLAFSQDEAEAFYALIMLLQTEQTNLQKIIEGIRYSVSPQEIEKYVII